MRLKQQTITQQLQSLQMERWAPATSLGQISQDAAEPVSSPAALDIAEPATPSLMLGLTSSLAATCSVAADAKTVQRMQIQLGQQLQGAPSAAVASAYDPPSDQIAVARSCCPHGTELNLDLMEPCPSPTTSGREAPSTA